VQKVLEGNRIAGGCQEPSHRPDAATWLALGAVLTAGDEENMAAKVDDVTIVDVHNF
jgi:hypothetical protein